MDSQLHHHSSCIWKAEFLRLQANIAKQLEDFSLDENSKTLVQNLQDILKNTPAAGTPATATAATATGQHHRPRADSTKNDETDPAKDSTSVPDLPQASHQVGSNALIIGEILKILSRTDHLTCRQVDRQWRDLATSSLQKMDHHRNQGAMTFFFDADTRSYATIQNNLSLKQVAHHIEKYYCKNGKDGAKKFPITNFALVEGHLRTRTVRRFFYVYGKFVKTLLLRLDYDSKSGQTVPEFVDSIRKLFVRQAVNLENLILDGLTARVTPDVDDEVDDNSPQGYQQQVAAVVQEMVSKLGQLSFRSLPNLKRLQLGHTWAPQETSKIFLNKILAAATNLRETIDFHLTYLGPFVDQNKIGTVKKLCAYERMFYATDTEVVADLEKFSEHTSQLECLKLDLYYTPELRSRVGLALKKILTDSQSSLKRIEYMEDFAWLDPAQLQLSQFKLTNVQDILIGRALEDSGLVQDGCRWADVLPCLRKVHILDFHQFDEKMWSDVFAGGEAPLLSVKILQLDFTCSVDMIQKFSSGMPNLVNLNVAVDSVHGCLQILKCLPQFFCHLKTVTVSVSGEYGSEEVEDINLELEAAAAAYGQKDKDDQDALNGTKSAPVVDIVFKYYSGRLRLDGRSPRSHNLLSAALHIGA